MSDEAGSESDDNVKEIKISEVKDKIIKQQTEELALKKKNRKKISKKKRNKGNIYDKYKQENEQNQLEDEEIQSVPLLLKQKKTRNAVDTKEIAKKGLIYIKNSKRLKIEDDNQNEEYDPVQEDITSFHKNHFYGNRINRCEKFITKI